MQITFILGVLLLCWAGYDLMRGKTWLHREFSRRDEPLSYWLTLGVWLAVAISCFYWSI